MNFYTYRTACTSEVPPIDGRVEGIIIPEGVSTDATVDFYFHGLDQENLVSGTDHFVADYANQMGLLDKIKESAENQEVLILLTGSNNHKAVNEGGNADSWMQDGGSDGKSRFNCFYEEALHNLNTLGVNPTAISLLGHSNGGNTIKNIVAENTFLSEQPLPLKDVILFDACYGDWCETIYDSVNSILTKELFVYYGDGTKTGSEKIESNENVNIQYVTFNHMDIPKKCLTDHLTGDACA